MRFLLLSIVLGCSLILQACDQDRSPKIPEYKAGEFVEFKNDGRKGIVLRPPNCYLDACYYRVLFDEYQTEVTVVGEVLQPVTEKK